MQIIHWYKQDCLWHMPYPFHCSKKQFSNLYPLLNCFGWIGSYHNTADAICKLLNSHKKDSLSLWKSTFFQRYTTKQRLLKRIAPTNRTPSLRSSFADFYSAQSGLSYKIKNTHAHSCKRKYVAKATALGASKCAAPHEWGVRGATVGLPTLFCLEDFEWTGWSIEEGWKWHR